MLLVVVLASVAPNGPNTPFHGGELVFEDTLRVIIIVLSVVSILATPMVVYVCRTMGQRVRITAMGLLALVAGSVEVEHIGDYANWRLGVSFFAEVATVWGFWSFFRYEIPAQMRTDTRYAPKHDDGAASG